MNSQRKPSDYVFSNQLLVGKIMNFCKLRTGSLCEYREEFFDTRAFVKLRTLNRTFNSVVLQQIRKEHQKVNLCAIYRTDADQIRRPAVRMNTSEEFLEGGYLNFLNEVAKVKVNHLEIESQSIDRNDRNLFHDELHKLMFRNRDYVKTFLGMKQLCENGCDECEYIVDRCQEYGPLQLGILLSDTKRHFNKCIISDRDLVDIARKLSKCAETREECLGMSEEMFNSNIFCDKLVFNLCEKGSFLMDRRRGISYKRVSLPWELIQTMMKNWNVKSVDLKFGDFFKAYRKEERDWTDVGFFTKFNWHYPFGNEDELVHKTRLQNVRIDLDESILMLLSILYPFRADEEMAKNFLVALTKPFPADKYQLILSLKPCIADNITDLMKATNQFIWRDDMSHMRLDVALFLDDPSTTSAIFTDSIFEDRPLTVTVNKWSERVAEFSPGYPFESFDPDLSNGYSIRVRDSKTDIEVNYDIFYARPIR